MQRLRRAVEWKLLLLLDQFSLGAGSGYLQTGSISARCVGVRVRLHSNGGGDRALHIRLLGVEVPHQLGPMSPNHRNYLDFCRFADVSVAGIFPESHSETA